MGVQQDRTIRPGSLHYRQIIGTWNWKAPQNVNRQKLIAYGAIPIGTTLLMIDMQFSGIDLLRNIIAPSIDGIYANSQRELGLLENLQNIVLLAMIIICVMGFRKKTFWLEKAGLGFIACCTLFLLLEEMDYGLHFYELIRGIKADEAIQDRNFHNVGDRTQTLKQLGDIGLILIFVIAPFALMKSRNRYIQYLLPDRYSVITLAGSLILSSLAHWLNDHGYAEEGVFKSNISEFREYQTYWLCMLYVRELALKRNLYPQDNSETSEDTDPLETS